MKTELERYKGALEYTIGELMRMHAISGERVRDDVGKILNPPALPPEMETVDVVRWECKNCGTMFYKLERCACMSADYPFKEADFIELTGTYQRPKPQMVERSVSVEAYVTPNGEVKPTTKDGYVNYPIFATSTEAHHKTGTLTFTWTEAPK